ncbi:DUF732 domain-containing protein [Aeromicrobium tamlense]|uniref:DUF732 domain-containing protein n=1 Tax=Aeromicrobium tamlense TaxID=375541 RepID=A0A8I0G0G8_9ACTN|nr:DUF732 domain-containing protein [Aeromicrobium tamlense]MBD1271908.1 DUF732 domain-containing protein [Aeromicrobium tamlense]NYI38902.1 hypothetical protein [Aeromicrobium tamlense]
MRRYTSPVIAGTLLGGLLAASSVGTAHADASDAALATALDLPAGITVTQAGDPIAFGVETRAFNDFPRRGGNGQYAVMSTGRASDIFNMSVPGLQPSTNLAGDDTVSMTFDVSAQAAGTCLLVDVAMGTEERVHTYDPNTALSDVISLKKSGDTTEYAMHAGNWYIGQDADRDFERTKVTPVPMAVNSIKYWHGINQEFERQPDDQSAPLLPNVTPFNHFSSVETFEVPVTTGSSVTLSIADANNASLDSVAMVDRVRTAETCSNSTSAETGLTPLRPAVVVGHRGVQNVLTVDLNPDTPQIERYDATDNGWHPGGVELRFRWYRYWIESSNCNDGLLYHWIPIQDADRQSFAPTLDEKGRCLMAVVTGKKDGYRSETFPSPASAQWTPTLPIQDGVFTNNAVPTITKPRNDIQVNDTLSASTGSFSPRPDSFSYQWWADNQPISGETGETFRVTAAQAGKVIRVRVTARRLNFDPMTIESAPTVTVTNLDFTSTPTPRIEGSGVQGKPLTAVPGTWTPLTDKFEYEWYADGEKIPSQTRATFTPSSGLIGSDVHAVVKGIRAGYNPKSFATPTVRITGASFTGGKVAVTGTLRVGQRLTASATGWTPVSPATRRYTWLVGGRIAQEGTSTMYTVPASAVGKSIVVQVRGERTGYAPITISSPATRAVARGVLTTNMPRVFGSARYKGTLRASASWRPAPVTYRYQWYVGSKRISKATKSSYKIPKKYRGKKIRVRITAYKSGYTTVSRYSGFTKIAKK